MAGIFEEQFADHRVIHVPADVDAQQRDAFVTKITAAVRKQAALAGKSGAVLRLDGSVRDEGDVLIIAHEPARPLRPAAIEQTDDLPTIEELLWIGATIIEALKAGGPGLIHGSILPESLYLDETGRVKLGDYGIVPAFEDVFGVDSRREVHCTGGLQPSHAGSTHCSGGWSRLSDADSREHGWVAPYLGHDLLSGTSRLNSKGDQFAAGVVLHALATGHHPFGAEFSDPSLMLYFHLEPYPLNEERSEWEEVFTRADKELATDADKPILAWSDLLRRLLASEPAERFANAAEAGKQIEPFCPADWRQATEALSKGMMLLDEGEVEALLAVVTPWRGSEALPALWRDQLDTWIADVEARKEEITAYKRLRLRLAEAQEALRSVEVDKARQIAREILESPQCDDELRATAEELINLGDEQAEFIASGADDLAVAYLDSARSSLAAYAFEPAQQVLRGLLSDPAIPKTRLAQARELLAEVELAEQRLEQQQRELAEATEDLQAWRLDAACQRLAALAEAGEMPSELAEQVAATLNEAQSAAQQRSEHLAKLEDAQTAWNGVDSDTLAVKLAEVPEDVTDPQVLAARAEFAVRLASLEEALRYQTDANARLETEDFEAALAAGEGGVGLGELPEKLGDELRSLADVCRAKIETRDRRQSEIDAATADFDNWRLDAACEKFEALAAADDLTQTQREVVEPAWERAQAALEARQAGQAALAEAETAWNAADLDALRAALERVPVHVPDPELSTPRAELEQRAAALADGLAERDRGRELLEAEAFGEALAIAEKAAARERLPEATLAELRALVDECRGLISQREREHREQAEAVLQRCAADLEELKVEPVDKTLTPTFVDDPQLPESLRQRARELRGVADRLASVLTRFEHAREHLKEGGFKDAAAILQGVQTDGLPAAAAAEAERLHGEVAEQQARHAEQMREGLAGQLGKVEKLLAEGQLDAAQTELGAVAAAEFLDDALRKRCDKCVKALKQYQPILAAIVAAEKSLDTKNADLAAVEKTLATLPGKLPAWAQPRVAAAREKAAKLADRRKGEAIKQAAAALDASAKALEVGDYAAAKGPLAQAATSIKLDEQLATRHAELTRERERLETWLPRVVELEQVLAQGDLLRVHTEAPPLVENKDVPPLARDRAAKLAKQADQLIAEGQKQIDGELDALAVELEERGRKARRFAQRAMQAVASPLATAEQHARAETLANQYEQLPRPPLPWKLIGGVGGAAAVIVIVVALAMSGAFERSEQPAPPVESPDTTVAEQPPAEEQQAAAAEQQTTTPPAEQDQQETQPVAAEADTPGELQQVDEPPAEETDTQQVATQADVPNETDESPIEDTPPPAEAPIAVRLAGALPQLQTRLDDAAAEARANDREVAAWTLAFDPPDEVPTRLIARRAGDSHTETVATVDDPAALATMELPAEALERLFPPIVRVDLGAVVKHYIDETEQQLDSVMLRAERVEQGADALRIAATWNGHALLPLTGFAFDDRAGVLTPGTEVIAAHFRSQVAALETLSTSLRTTFNDGNYDAVLKFAGDPQVAKIQSIDAQNGVVALRTTATLEGDSRADAGFPISLRYENEQLAISGDADAAFTDYLTDLQTPKSAEAAAALAKALGAAGSLRVQPQPDASGAQVNLAITTADGQPLTTATATWIAATLSYDVDADAVRTAIRSTIRERVAAGDTIEALRATWSKDRAALAPATGQPGSAFFDQLDLLELAVQEQSPADVLSVAVQATLGPAEASAAERLSYPARLKLSGSQFAWDPESFTLAKTAIAGELQRLSQSPLLRRQRTVEAIAALAREVGVAPDAIKTQAEDDTLRAEVAAAGGSRIFTWNWDTAGLRYAGRREAAPAVLTLDQKLAKLAQQGQVETAALHDVLKSVAESKLARLGAAEFQLADSLAAAADPAAALIATSGQLQRLAAPRPQSEPLPNVFVEYYVGERDVYGLAWHAETDKAATVTGITDARVWRVMPTSQLQGYANPEAFRAAYTKAQLGELLLGPALGESITAAAGGSFGLMIAPDGLLWFVRWEQVAFNARPVQGIDNRGVGNVGQVARLRELLAPGNGGKTWRRAGVWCVPCLAGQWTGAIDRNTKLNLGPIVPGQKPSTLRFRQRGQVLIASVNDPTLAGDFAWTQFVREVDPATLGAAFWDRRWENGEWMPTPFTSFSLLPRK